jgi:hypothetical protein
MMMPSGVQRTLIMQLNPRAHRLLVERHKLTATLIITLTANRQQLSVMTARLTI